MGDRGDINRLRWQITAPPRSGTTWIAHYLSSFGYPTSHERAFLTFDQADPGRFKPHQPRKPGDSSWAAAPWCRELRDRGVLVVHLRRPVEDVAASMQRLGWDLDDGGSTFGTALRHFTPGVFDEEPKSFAQYLRFATEWTGLITADVTWDLYDVDETVLKDLEGLI